VVKKKQAKPRNALVRTQREIRERNHKDQIANVKKERESIRISWSELGVDWGSLEKKKGIGRKRREPKSQSEEDLRIQKDERRKGKKKVFVKIAESEIGWEARRPRGLNGFPRSLRVGRKKKQVPGKKTR